ncbi:MAG: hypothetical protein MJZ93_01120 [Paludibacteraceae bacterium]|nr:hypothetical protein [Paludibacteraceae bacterium]
MAKVNGVASQLSGKVGQLIYRQTKYGTVVYEAPVKANVPQRSEAQMQVRTQLGNLAAVYGQFNKTLKRGFEGLNGKMSDFNAFVQANMNVVKVYVPKSVRLNGGSVLAPYQITRGTLPSVAMHKDASGVLVSDIAVGSLVIGEETTVADLACAVVAMNAEWEEGDQITFFYGEQATDAVTGIPRARIYGSKVMLNPGDTTPLLEVVSALGFTVVDGCLAMDRAIASGAAVWVHSRDDVSNGSAVRVSTQFMYVDSALLASYQSAQAMVGAANSYGGVNVSAVYLKPGSKFSIGMEPMGSGTSGGGTGSGSGSGSGSGDGEGTGGSGSGEGDNPVVKKMVSLSVSPAGAGTVTGGGQYDAGASATLKAVAASGFHFVKWSDNNTSATRTVTVNGDLSLQAIFAADAPQGGGGNDDENENPGGGSGSGDEGGGDTGGGVENEDGGVTF